MPRARLKAESNEGDISTSPENLQETYHTKRLGAPRLTRHVDRIKCLCQSEAVIKGAAQSDIGAIERFDRCSPSDRQEQAIPGFASDVRGLVQKANVRINE